MYETCTKQAPSQCHTTRREGEREIASVCVCVCMCVRERGERRDCFGMECEKQRVSWLNLSKKAGGRNPREEGERDWGFCEFGKLHNVCKRSVTSKEFGS